MVVKMVVKFWKLMGCFLDEEGGDVGGWNWCYGCWNGGGGGGEYGGGVGGEGGGEMAGQEGGTVAAFNGLLLA